MREECRNQALQRRQCQPGRWNMLSEDWDNVESVAMKLSYKPEWLTENTYRQWSTHRTHALQYVAAEAGPEFEQLRGPKRKPRALEDSAGTLGDE